MITYIILIIILLMPTILYAIYKKRQSIYKVSNIFLVLTGMILILFSGLRGGFTSDYQSYVNLFDFYNKFSLSQIFHYQFGQEIGYVLLSRFVGFFTDSSIPLMLLAAAITIVFFFVEIKENSEYVWLSVLFFVTIGQFYTSFNLIRQILAVAIIFAGSEYLYKKKILKYIIVILIASLFHKTALIMIPFYFILNLKFSWKKMVITFFGLLLIIMNFNVILVFIQKYFYSYYKATYYGMSGYSYKNIILPCAILIFVLLHKSLLDTKNENKTNIWVNSMVFYAFFSILGMKVQLIERLAQYFAPFVLLIIPLIVFKQENKYLRAVYIFTIVVLSVAYNYVTLKGTGFEPFYFIQSIGLS